MFKAILYYKFHPIEHPEKFCFDHKKKCRELNLLGRVLIAREGINGTLTGTTENIDAYKIFLRSLPGFGDTEFKEDVVEVMPFVKLIVKTRPEIVTLDAPADVAHGLGGKHVSPAEWKQMLESGEDYLVLDVRNDYESAIGHFKSAVCPDVKNFFDFPQWLQNAKLDKNKKVMMYCTGGIRCEKFSVYMKDQGFQDIVQLHGGIINYAKEIGGEHYQGKCFVFDDRMAVPIEKNQKEPISRCAITGEPCDRYINCAHLDCNKMFICSIEGAKKFEGCCSEECMKNHWRRPLNEHNIYEPARKWYTYFKEKIISAS